jgi:hypothetical protein
MSRLCTGPSASKAEFEKQCSELDTSGLAVLVGAFGYLKSLGLELWNETGMRLLPLDNPGHMALSGNALTQLHVLEGAILWPRALECLRMDDLFAHAFCLCIGSEGTERHHLGNEMSGILFLSGFIPALKLLRALGRPLDGTFVDLHCTFTHHQKASFSRRVWVSWIRQSILSRPTDGQSSGARQSKSCTRKKFGCNLSRDQA